MMLITIVIYNKLIVDLPVLKNSDDLNSNIDIFIYDNSPTPQLIPNIEFTTIFYEHDSSNSGVSRAYNQAAIKAKSLKKNLILILDQDTKFDLNYISKYKVAYEKHGTQYIYAPIVCDESATKIYSPSILNNFIGKIQLFKNFNFNEKYDLSGKSLINSGLMIPLPIFEEIGGYKETIKLDFSDIYFIEKYKKLSREVILLDIQLKHSISGDEGKDFNREYTRYKYYCEGAKNLGYALNKSIYLPPFRRLIRLIIKYKTLRFINIFFNHHLKSHQ